jgi:hypothetical protein
VSELFNGTDGQAQWSIGGCNLTGAWTLVNVVKFDAGVSWQSMLGNDHATSGSELAIGRHTDGRYWVLIGGGAGGAPVSTFTISSADGWLLLASRRPAGASQTVRHTKYPIGGSPTHQDATGTMNNSLTQAGGKVVFGQIDGADFFKGRLAVAAEFNANLSDADLESLVTTFSRANWLSLGAVGLWDAYDRFATDRTGNGADQTLLTGTTVDADDPTGWAQWEGITVDYDYAFRFPKPKLRALAREEFYP